VWKQLAENYYEPKNGFPEASRFSIVVTAIGFENKSPWL